MNLSEADITKLENYWNGQLAPSEQTELEKRLAEDTAFRDAAAEWQFIIREAFMPPKEEVAEAAEIKKRLLSYQEDQNSTKQTAVESKPKRSLSVSWIAIGLAIAAALLLLLWLNPLNSALQEQRPSDGFFAHLSRDNANLSDEGPLGRQAYDQHQYAKAYPALVAEVEAGGDSLNLIYAGVAAIGSGQADKAIALLEPLVNAKSWSFYQSEIRWYLALAYLDNGEIDRTNDLLNLLIQADDAYAEDAKNLIQKIANTQNQK